MRRAIVAAGCVAALCAGAARMPIVDILHAGQETSKIAKVIFFGMQVEGHGPGGRYTNLYLVMGEDHHSAAVLADDQIVLVDTKSTAGWGAPMMEVLGSVSEQPVVTLINTNPHQGGSNAEFPKAVDIIAHENTKARMARLAGPNAKLPTKTFTDRLTLPVKTTGANDGSSRLDLLYFGPGYTDGDTVVVFPQYNSVFFGELFPGKSVPLVDRANGGSALRFPDTLDKVLAAMKTYMPPFQALITVRQPPPLASTAMLTNWGRLRNFEEYVDFVHALVSASRAAHDAKKSVDQAVAGFSLPDRFKDYSLERLRPFAQAAYDELR